MAATTALLTAIYMFRLLWLTFFGRSRMDAATEHHVHESPWSMTGILIVLAALSTVGGFIPVPHFLEPMLPLPPVTPGLEGFHTPIVVASIVIAFAGLAVAALLFGRDARLGEAIHSRVALLHRLLSGKYYIDEIYSALIGRPLYWISDHVFLRLGDRALIDGSLHSIAALGRYSAAALGRVQTGQLQFYALLVLVGLVASLAWSWHG
jgi:NADH-quinone oxidoreductase subunit L